MDAPEFAPLVYDELRRLAAAKLAREPAGQTLDATGLVHEAFLRLGADESFADRTEFFKAAATAMRRILVDRARAKRSDKRGGKRQRVKLDDVAGSLPDDDLLALDDALLELKTHDPTAAELVELRYFAGFSHTEAAQLLGITRRQADGVWALAKAWLYTKIGADG